VLQGDIHEIRMPRGQGHEQQGRRFGVVVQANELLPRSVVLIAPTSCSARLASFRPEIDILGEHTKVLVEQVGAVDAGRLGDLVGRVTPEEQWGIDEALLTVSRSSLAARGGRPSPGYLLVAWVEQANREKVAGYYKILVRIVMRSAHHACPSPRRVARVSATLRTVLSVPHLALRFCP
jgi:mRNA interferase MazF